VIIITAEDVKNSIKDLNDLDEFVRLEAENVIASNMPEHLDIIHEEVVKEYYHKNIKLSLIAIMVGVKDPSSIDVFIKLLSDKNKWVRRHSSTALAEYGEDAVDKLIEVTEDPNWRTRGGAIWALSKIANPRTLDILIKASKDEESFVRSGSVFGLGAIGGEKAKEALQEVVRTDTNGFAKANAITFLEKME